VTATTAVSALNGRVTAEAFSAATVLAPALAPTEPTILGTRIGAAVFGTARTGATAAGTFTVEARAEATAYPAQDAWQWGVRVAPGWRYVSGPLTLRLSYDQRFTNSGSPFGASVDRLQPRSRADGGLRVEGPLFRGTPSDPAWPAPRLDGYVEVRGVHDLVPVGNDPAGWRMARAWTGVTYRVRGWVLGSMLLLETAGLLNTGSSWDAHVTLDLSAERPGWPVLFPSRPQPNVPHTAFEVGLNSVYGLTADNPGLRSLELRAAMPFAFDHFEARPYLAFDFEPTIEQGLWPIWSVHGLDLTLISCCGSVTVGYRNDSGQWSASIAVDLERRPPRR